MTKDDLARSLEAVVAELEAAERLWADLQWYHDTSAHFDDHGCLADRLDEDLVHDLGPRISRALQGARKLTEETRERG